MQHQPYSAYCTKVCFAWSTSKELVQSANKRKILTAGEKFLQQENILTTCEKFLKVKKILPAGDGKLAQQEKSEKSNSNTEYHYFYQQIYLHVHSTRFSSTFTLF